ncbi:hypothetical protein [Herpetosiphon geysericola]|uniref:DUF4367 domain-containing protein n=1 Tax=Herpetosiphon geysericola TaxID=70996 RepID=A0A0P6YIN7_9CHLR|nr:hypothetical protein [Herpetosiphon geysericola]KPL90414.1 hypothetical protein SE18_07350 [Herpetosiphon geysericola]
MIDKQIQQFNADVDHLLSTGQLPSSADADHQALLQLAQQLGQIGLQPNSTQQAATAKQVQQLLGNRKPLYGGFMLKSKLRIGLALVMALVVATVAVPPLRSYASQILHQIGWLTVNNGPTKAEQVFTATEEPPIPNQATAAPPVLSDASPFDATYLPAGYVATPGYSGRYYFNESAADSITVWVRSLEEGSTLSVGAASTTQITVRNKPGLYIEQAPLYVKNSEGPIYQENLETVSVNLILWEENGQIITVESYKLDQTTLLQVAEGLQAN